MLAKSKTARNVLGKAGKAVKGLMGGKKGASTGRRRRRLSLNRKFRQLIVAKIDGKIMKAKYGSLLR